MQKINAKPFVKWAGGKGQLLEKLNTLYPKELFFGEIETYIEPFVGGGAVLFDVLQKFEIQRAVIVDLNKELINCYQAIKYDCNELIDYLEKLQQEFLSISNDDRKEFYLDIRKRYNSTKIESHIDFKKAADFIFLNKTCFNGLYRVNSKGEFNVPFGYYANPKICDKQNLQAISSVLQRVKIIHGNYSECKKFANGKSFVYLDPPYRPLTVTQSFVGYQQGGFDDNSQKELAQFVSQLSEQGAKILLSNSDPKNIDPSDDFFEELYIDFEIERVQAKRMINSNAEKRGNVSEIVVSNCKTHSLLEYNKEA